MTATLADEARRELLLEAQEMKWRYPDLPMPEAGSPLRAFLVGALEYPERHALGAQLARAFDPALLTYLDAELDRAEAADVAYEEMDLWEPILRAAPLFEMIPRIVRGESGIDRAFDGYVHRMLQDVEKSRALLEAQRTAYPAAVAAFAESLDAHS